jgi:predicted ATP-dependent endonuclease of OLD family
MILRRVEVCGFKRFRKQSTLDVNGKLTAILGPNEAGKSSLLRALVHWNNDANFNDGVHGELTSEKEFDEDDKVISCFFSLEDSDKEKISHIPESKDLRFFEIYKTRAGEVKFTNDPIIYRDTTSRLMIVEALERAISNKSLRFLNRLEEKLNNEFDENTTNLLTGLDDLIETLNQEEEDLDSESIEIIQDSGKVISSMLLASDPGYVKNLPKQIHDFIENESRLNPHYEIINILSELKPNFLLFTEDDRELNFRYDLQSLGNQSTTALKNLLAVGGVSIEEIVKNATSGKEQLLLKMERKCNERLKYEFKVWNQSEDYPIIKIDGTILRIYFGDKDVHSIAIRSDGLRQFIALFAFVKKNQKVVSTKDILLIDEPEMHLHYDAQADLVQMLASQKLVERVIYATHSIGCLPEDLGGGVKLIKYKEDDDSSEIINRFWADNKPGVTSVLYEMGAASLAFIPIRNTLFSEGIVDHILLPSMLKEALETDHIGFMVAPGLSISSEEQINLICDQAPKILFLTDSDHGKKSLWKKLTDAGIEENRIFELPKKNGNGAAIEDLIDKSTYLQAINAVIKMVKPSAQLLSLEDIPEYNRAVEVNKYCKKINSIEPSKRVVAHFLIELTEGDLPIIDLNYKPQLIKLYDEINHFFFNSPVEPLN